ncbi:hypothetical protein BSK59_13650 [Paenibacillus odorifer]|uniref:hypothetical protein n=1 Tax=Paenibacillus odorifer TaxID=189426 RepID=UPI00096E3F0F|nr:hypothetical protein [Paenibacillus odorifer]OME55516.1 hypothetical protein BSK59_13650 [Paenibacillus odorifer]
MTKMTDIYHQRLQSITEALNTLSMHFSIEIKREATNDCRGDVYREVDYFIDCYLKEYYKNSSNIKVKIT